MSCREVLAQNYNLTITLSDSKQNEIEIKLTSANLLIEGAKINDSYQGKCILPLFPQDKSPNEWMLGTIIMQKYYLVFDATPHYKY